MAGDAPESKPTREETAANILRLGKLLNDLAYPERGIAGRPNRPYEAERLKTEIQALEKRIELAVYDPTQRLLRSALEIRGDGVMDVIALRVVSYVAWAATHLNHPGVPVARVAHAVSLGDDMRAHLQGRRLIRSMVIGEKGVRFKDSEFGHGGELLPGERLVKYLSGEGHLSVVWTEQSLKEEKEEWERRKSGAVARRIPLAKSAEHRLPADAPGSKAPLSDAQSPKAIFESLRRTVIGMDPVVKRFAVQMAIHLRRVAIMRNGTPTTIPSVCCLLIGPSGSGKTFLAEEFGRLAGLPFAVGNMAEVSSSSYVGASVDELFLGFIKKGVSLSDAQAGGILFLDEIDKKKANATNGQHDSVGEGPQGELLRLLESSGASRFQIGGRRSNDLPRGSIRTDGMAFILAGAFSGMEALIRDKQRSRVPMGFSGDGGNKDMPPDIREFLLDWFIPELLNRIGSVIVIPPPSRQQLVLIGTAPTGIVARQNQFLASFGITVVPSPEAIQEIASWALETRTFARGMRSLLQSLVEEAIFEERKGDIVIGAVEVKRAIEGLRGEPEGLKTRT